MSDFPPPGDGHGAEGAEGFALSPEQAAFVADMHAAAAQQQQEDDPWLGQHVAATARVGSASLVLIPLCRKGDRAAIERHLQAGTGSVAEVDCEGNTPLHVAVEAPKNEIATVQCLLENGADINAVNYLGATPLHYVCLRKSNYRGIANILLEHGAAINSQTLAGKTPLHFSCEQQIPELVEVLCLFGSEPNLVDVESNSSVHFTLSKSGGRDTVKRQILEQLLNSGTGFQSPNLEGLMPVHLAARGGYIRCVQLLVEWQADATALTGRGETALHLSAKANYPEVTQILLQAYPQLVDLADAEGNTALHCCAASGSLDCAILLMRMGASPGLQNRHGKTAFDIAKTRGTDLNNTHSPELEQMLKDAQKGGNCTQS